MLASYMSWFLDQASVKVLNCIEKKNLISGLYYRINKNVLIGTNMCSSNFKLLLCKTRH